MSGSERILRQQYLREAEGYLELIWLAAEAETPPSGPCRRLAERTLGLLERLPGEAARRPHALLLRGQALRTLGRYEEAIAPLVEAAEREPENIQVWLAMGWCYKRIGRLDLAIQALEEALVAEPDDSLVQYNLACYWSLAEKPQQALHYLSLALAADSHYRSLIENEHDFDPIRNHPGFQALCLVGLPD